MKGRRRTPEQVVRKLREADRLLAEAAELPDVCRHLEISIQTYQRWRTQYKAMRPEDVVRLKQLEKENARLKRLLAERVKDPGFLGGSSARLCPGGRRCSGHGSPEEVPR